MTMIKEKVFVGLSGGVDSSVAALRLVKRGYTVVGVFIKVWQPDFLLCDWEEERLDAMRVAAELDIPFLTYDAVEVYKREVADYMIREYKAGRTPNPDIMCNQHVKFGAFLQFAIKNGADRVATGHYAKLLLADGRYQLYRGADPRKDQSYFLWSLKQEQLRYIDFPIGDTLKDHVRSEAERATLPVAQKDDSQGICFLGQVDVKEFLSHYIQTSSGSVLDKNGTVIGTHGGALFYTIGQRHGFTITRAGTQTAPHFVTQKDMIANTITVSKEPSAIGSLLIALKNINQINSNWEGEVSAQFRYRQKPFPVEVQETKKGCVMLNMLEEAETPSSGQSCVLYRGDECLGGGIIT